MKRVIKTFEPDPDILKMLARAKVCGVKLTYLCNQALRKYLTESGWSRKGDSTTKGAGK